MISLQRYAALFRQPDMAKIMLASVVGRIPIGMAGLAILLFVQGSTGSFSRAGAASALYVMGLAALAPLFGRLIDRYGPRPVLTLSALVYPAALFALVATVAKSANFLWIAASAFLAGAALPPITIVMRALLPQLLNDVSLMQTAYSVDSALIELVFIIGPALVALFVALDMAGFAVLFAAGCGALGAAIFLRSPAARRWTLQPSLTRGSPLGPLRSPGLRTVLGVTAFYSLAFGLFEVAATGFAAARGMPAAAGLILGLASVGSTLGALVYGSRDWPLPVPKQYVISLALMGAGMLLLAPVTNIYMFALISVVSAAPMATVLAVQSLLVSRVSPPAALAESFTWVATSLLGGISAGIAAGGWMLEHFPPSLVLLAAAAATGFAALLAWSTQSGLRSSASETRIE